MECGYDTLGPLYVGDLQMGGPEEVAGVDSKASTQIHAQTSLAHIRAIGIANHDVMTKSCHN